MLEVTDDDGKTTRERLPLETLDVHVEIKSDSSISVNEISSECASFAVTLHSNSDVRTIASTSGDVTVNTGARSTVSIQNASSTSGDVRLSRGKIANARTVNGDIRGCN